MILRITIISFILFFLTSRVLEWGLLYESFGFQSMPQYVGLLLIGFMIEPIGFFLSPVSMARSRKHEREADDYAYRLIKDIGPFINALKRMAADNLSNLRPHPLYVRFHYSHPPILERIKRLEHLSSEK
jgi:STE24 endopeptidase